jgi:uncharacterized protein (UPF0548 family)
MTIGPMRGGSAEDDSTLNYAAIGATQTREILQYPPKGYTSGESSRRIGSGTDRFEQAARVLMTWGVQRGSGVLVEDVQLETDEDTYAGVEFDAEGRPTGRSEIPEEQLYSPDGVPYVAAGMTAELVFVVGPARIRVPVKVIYVIDEPGRVGFAYGSRIGAPSEFERLMLIEQHDDGGVWFTIRAFSRPIGWWQRVVLGVLRLGQKRYTERYLTALHPTRTAQRDS